MLFVGICSLAMKRALRYRLWRGKKQRYRYNHPYSHFKAPFSSKSTTQRDLRGWGTTLTEFPASERRLDTSEPNVCAVYRIDDGGHRLVPLDVAKTDKNYAPENNAASIHLLQHFLPANYPQSVSHNYIYYASYAFGAGVAGSAAMVLSTQTLLLAVGVVGNHHAPSASIMAGALNWVLKDGIGQLGGVLFASRMGRTRRFDADPKRWRVAAAVSLDASNLLDVLAPLIPPSFILPLACFSNVLKNISFLAASASRAALHLALAGKGNLADVTAKAGSQSIMAGLVGTSMGIGISWLLHQDPSSYITGFVALSAVHQGCNYLSLRHVSLNTFNQQRLLIVLETYLSSGDGVVGGDGLGTSRRRVLTPAETAKQERIFWSFKRRGYNLFSVGQPLDLENVGKDDLESLWASVEKGKNYWLVSSSGTTDGVNDGQSPSRNINLIFFEGSKGQDIISGFVHALVAHSGCSSSSVDRLVADLIPKLETVGWNISEDFMNVEGDGAKRVKVQRSR